MQKNTNKLIFLCIMIELKILYILSHHLTIGSILITLQEKFNLESKNFVIKIKKKGH